MKLIVSTGCEEVDWEIEINRQTKLSYDCFLNQQADELYLNIKSFCLGWFPSDDPKIFEDFMKVVIGLISRNFRIIEYTLNGKGIGGDLQELAETGWKTIGKSGIFTKWFSKSEIIHNVY